MASKANTTAIAALVGALSAGGTYQAQQQRIDELLPEAVDRAVAHATNDIIHDRGIQHNQPMIMAYQLQHIIQDVREDTAPEETATAKDLALVWLSKVDPGDEGYWYWAQRASELLADRMSAVPPEEQVSIPQTLAMMEAVTKQVLPDPPAPDTSQPRGIR